MAGQNLVADKDRLPNRKDIYIALDNNFESKLFEAELTRNWENNNGPNTTENRIKAAEMTRLQHELKTKYNFIILRNDINKDMYKLIAAHSFPSYKLSKRGNDWYPFDKRAFLSSTFCIRYLDVILSQPVADDYCEQGRQVEIQLVNKLKEDRWHEIEKECIKIWGPEEYEYNVGCSSVWGFNGFAWEKVQQASPGSTISNPYFVISLLENRQANVTQYTDYDYIDNRINEIYIRHSTKYYDENNKRYQTRYKITYFDIKKLKINLDLPGECFKFVYITRKNFPWEAKFKYRPD